MKYENQLQMLKENVGDWNTWRSEHPEIPIDLCGACLISAQLPQANLHGANLSGAMLRDADLRGTNLSIANLSNADLRGANLSIASLNQANLRGANLSGAKFHNAVFVSADLSGANLSAADFRDVIIEGANLTGANLSGANLSAGQRDSLWDNLHGARLRGANLSGANLSYAGLRNADLSDADLSDANCLHTSFRDADLRGAKDLPNALRAGESFRDANLRGVSLSGADLCGARLRYADLGGADLSGAKLEEADLSGANLIHADLSGALLFHTNLSGANLSEANLSSANLRTAIFSGADLSGADLSFANLSEANLNSANLSRANLRFANLEKSIVVRTNFSNADLEGCRVFGVSAWGLTLDGAKQKNVRITPDEESTITVDDLEVAQFIYLMLNNQKVRNVIDTITSKTVLILGRFKPERKAVLDRIRDELRKNNYLPILFDFDVPSNRDITETVTLLARMARFIIADLTEASSIPKELEAIVPTLAVPVQPLLEGSSSPYSMFKDNWKYDWVLAVHRYDGLNDLIASIDKKVIAPAESKARDLEKRRNEART